LPIAIEAKETMAGIASEYVLSEARMDILINNRMELLSPSFALAAVSGDRGENGAQPVFKTGVCWRGERSTIDAIQSLGN
jgi:hypothetical protein